MDDEARQSTFTAEGEVTDRPPDAAGTNDFGEEKSGDETDGGHSRYAVSSLLQKAVRRSDEVAAAWAAWELARSGCGWNLWERLNVMVLEDLRAGDPVAQSIARYEELADRFGEASLNGRRAAVQAALAAARAHSTREASHAENYYSLQAERRAAGDEADWPGDDLRSGGRYDVALDAHTGEGSRRGRDSKFFRVHAARVGPGGESADSARWKRRRMEADENEYDEAALDHALSPVTPGRRWEEPQFDRDRTPTDDDTRESG